MWLTTLCAIVLGFARVNVGDSSYNLFIFPTAPGPNNNFVADLSWPVGSIQKIQWSTTLDGYYIALFQQSINPASGGQLLTIYTADSGGAGQQSFLWLVQTYNSNLSSSPVYFLWLNPGDPQGFTSHYFNITNPVQSSSSSSSSGSSSSSSISSISSSTTTAFTSSTPTPPQTGSDTAPSSPSTPSSSTETVKVGLGVGLGIGIPLVLIAGIWIGLKLVKQRQSSSRSIDSGVPLSQFPDARYPPKSNSPPNISMNYANEIHEAPAHERPLTELGS